MAFDLASVLKNVSTLDTVKHEQIEYIDLQDIAQDNKNFYALRNINELADNIQLIGLQQPLRVREFTGIDGLPSYRIVSGHRRFAALRLLECEEPAGGWNKVPCIVERDSESEALQELRLIYANSSTRILTPFELERQAERVRDLLSQLRDEGMEFKGRMRDHVAQACQISATKLARLEAIRNNLDEDLYNEFWETGRLTETAAYALSRMDVQLQTETMDNLWHKRLSTGRGRFTEKEIMDEAAKISRAELKAAAAETKAEEPAPENVSIPDTSGITVADENVSIVDTSSFELAYAPPHPCWFTGEPPFDGPYVCRISFDGRPFGSRMNLNWKDGQWMIPGASSSIDEGTTVTGWWPVPEV